MSEPIEIYPYSAEWPVRFQETGRVIRKEMGDAALRIDHIGSTAVPNLAAKPVIDIQISVASLDEAELIQTPLQRAGFIYRAGNPDLTKRYFRERPGTGRTHIHVRRAGNWSEQFALLFRDYLRSDERDCTTYAIVKRHLAEKYRDDREGYVTAKTPIIWEIMQRASIWSQHTGWMPPPTDI